MKTSISSKSPHSPLSTISAPITIEASATSLSSVVSSLPVATSSSSASKNTHVKCGISCGRNASPCNVESIRSQSLDDNTHKMLIKQSARGGCKIINIPTMSATNHERDSSIASLSNSIRQNSAKINNCSKNHAESSTNNGSSANTASSTSESSVNVNEEGKKTLTKEDDREKSNSSTSSTTSISSSNSNTTFTSSLSTISNNLSVTILGVHKNITGVEEDKNVTIKEEHSISPNISPLGFSPLDQGPNNNSAIPETSVSNAKLNEVISTKKCNVLSNKVHFLPNIVCNGNEESNNKNQTSVILSQSSGYTYSSNTNSNGMPHINGNSTIAGGSCLDYMQHQNHIFVFSTQLANKSADAVLNGQFPTIIAYHCSQPATKSFLEDFFLKNSMKMTKLQRQSTLNMCNISIGNSGEVLGTQSWLNTIAKMPQKTSDNKNGEDNDIHSWDQTHSDIEVSSAGRNSRKSTDNVVSRNNLNNTKPLGVTELDANIPSLQGVKVPDENLTPQQRQHREEQLAKLKKIDQFLFPENDSNEFRGEISSNQIRKITVDGIVTTLPANLMHNISSDSSNANSSSCIKNSIQNISNNLMKAEGMSATTDNASTSANSNNLSILPGYNSNKVSNLRLNNSIMDSLTNSLTSNVSNILPNISGPASINNSPVNPINNMINNPITKKTLENLNNSAMLSTTGSSNVMNDENSGSNSLNSNAISEFVQNFPTISDDRGESLLLDRNQKHIVISNSCDPNIAGSSEGVGGSLTQMEWSTLQQQFYGERFKINVTDTGCIITPSSRPTSIITNGNTHSNTTSSESPVASSHRSVQGPPPPYHQSTGTQRPASVPISTQSSNPASPNNPTSNLSLPSPRTSSIMGMTNNSPNIDAASLSIVSSSISTPASVAISVISAGGGASSNCINNITKVSFSQEKSPSSNQNLIAGGGSVVLCNRNNTSVINSYPATSLSDISSKEKDTSILINSPSDTSKMETRFSSPGLMCSRGAGSNTGGTNNGFKNQSSLERQNTPQMSSQFNRRSDNIPLNPNSNRAIQNKMINAFDPISSLAQMSQQLTGCVGLGNHSSNMSILGSTGGATVGEVSSGLSMDNVIGPLETSLEHCTTSANISIPVTSGSVPSFTSNCQLMGPMTQRLINSNCSGSTSTFNAATLGLKGDSTIPGMIVSHRMINHPRMTSSFGNFNVAPNIQVKASTPNTIQYLPVRTQNNATNNIRVPPSLEFLHRYTNPQMLGAGVSGPTSGTMENLSIGNQMSSQNDMKFTNGGNNIGLNINQTNFFSGCNTLNSMCIPDQDEVQSVNGIVSDHDIQMSLQGNLLRGLRPMRQTCINKIGAAVVTPGSRIQNPIISGKRPPSVVPNAILPFVTNDFESMDIVDQTVPIFNNTINGNAGSMQVYQQKPVNKVVHDSGLLPSLNSANNNITGSQNGMLLNDPLSLHTSVMISRSGLNNSNVLSNSLSTNGSVMPSGYTPGSPMNYKSFVGPNSNDIKYAQQFHSFQQQLYATSIRGQQPENVSNPMHTANCSSTSFFVNK